MQRIVLNTIKICAHKVIQWQERLTSLSDVLCQKLNYRSKIGTITVRVLNLSFGAWRYEVHKRKAKMKFPFVSVDLRCNVEKYIRTEISYNLKESSKIGCLIKQLIHTSKTTKEINIYRFLLVFLKRKIKGSKASCWYF